MSDTLGFVPDNAPTNTSFQNTVSGWGLNPSTQSNVLGGDQSTLRSLTDVGGMDFLAPLFAQFGASGLGRQLSPFENSRISEMGGLPQFGPQMPFSPFWNPPAQQQGGGNDLSTMYSGRPPLSRTSETMGPRPATQGGQVTPNIPGGDLQTLYSHPPGAWGGSTPPRSPETMGPTGPSWQSPWGGTYPQPQQPLGRMQSPRQQPSYRIPQMQQAGQSTNPMFNRSPWGMPAQQQQFGRPQSPQQQFGMGVGRDTSVTPSMYAPQLGNSANSYGGAPKGGISTGQSSGSQWGTVPPSYRTPQFGPTTSSLAGGGSLADAMNSGSQQTPGTTAQLGIYDGTSNNRRTDVSAGLVSQNGAFVAPGSMSLSGFGGGTPMPMSNGQGGSGTMKQGTAADFTRNPTTPAPAYYPGLDVGGFGSGRPSPMQPAKGFGGGPPIKQAATRTLTVDRGGWGAPPADYQTPSFGAIPGGISSGQSGGSQFGGYGGVSSMSRPSTAGGGETFNMGAPNPTAAQPPTISNSPAGTAGWGPPPPSYQTPQFGAQPGSAGGTAVNHPTNQQGNPNPYWDPSWAWNFGRSPGSSVGLDQLPDTLSRNLTGSVYGKALAPEASAPLASFFLNQGFTPQATPFDNAAGQMQYAQDMFNQQRQPGVDWANALLRQGLPNSNDQYNQAGFDQSGANVLQGGRGIYGAQDALSQILNQGLPNQGAIQGMVPGQLGFGQQQQGNAGQIINNLMNGQGMFTGDLWRAGQGLFGRLGGPGSQLPSERVDPQTASTAYAPAAAAGDPRESNAGAPIQSTVENSLQGLIQGGGISDPYVNAMRERVLRPSMDALTARLNAQGGGQADINSPLFQEQRRKLEADFNNDMIRQGFSNIGQFMGQGTQLGGQQFGQDQENIRNLMQTGLFNAGNQQQANLANAGAQNAMAQFNVGNNLQGQLANQQNTRLGGAQNQDFNLRQFQQAADLQNQMQNQYMQTAGMAGNLGQNAFGNALSGFSGAGGLGLNAINSAAQQGNQMADLGLRRWGQTNQQNLAAGQLGNEILGQGGQFAAGMLNPMLQGQQQTWGAQNDMVQNMLRYLEGQNQTGLGQAGIAAGLAGRQMEFTENQKIAQAAAQGDTWAKLLMSLGGLNAPRQTPPFNGQQGDDRPWWQRLLGGLF